MLNNLSKIEGIYVVHAKKGYEYHEKRLKGIFNEFKLNAEFVSEGDPSSFSSGILEKYFCENIQNKLSPGVLSCTLNHILCYEEVVKRKNRFALIFENDPYFIGDFLNKISKILKEVEHIEKGFIISLENTTLEFPSYRIIKPNKYIYAANHGRCAGAYLIDFNAAFNILNDLKEYKCCQVIDWWHNNLIKKDVIKMYWAHPPLTEQGSHNGLMSSTISTKRKSYKRRVQWLIQKYYKMYIRIWFK